MRIISGALKGRKLVYPADKIHLRPTKDRVKEALFSIVGARLDGAVVLDLCCGTGGLGLEALSRGAKRVVFVDTFTGYVAQNIEICQVTQSPAVQVVRSDVLKFLTRCTEAFDVVFVDPPWSLPKSDQTPQPKGFQTELYQAILASIESRNVLSPKGLLVCEHPARMSLLTQTLKLKSKHQYGTACLSLFAHQL